jgi:tRNA(Ile2)-agmatinylcytidine synthase
MLKVMEPIERWVIFRSNQGTDAHLTKLQSLDKAQPYSSVIAKGTVSSMPRVIPGRHVIFSVKDETAQIDCAAYEPTGSLRKIARELMIGDQIEVYGAVRKPTANKPLTVNLEKIKILKMTNKTQRQNPICPNCGKRLKSMGKNQGLRCSKCGKRYVDKKKIEISQERTLKTGLYITSTRSQRHLMKPTRRYGQEKHEPETIKLIDKWASISPT